jgi:hypothetical protein
MEGTALFAAWFMAIAVAVPCLAGYSYLLFTGARSLGFRLGCRRRHYLVYSLLMAASLAIGFTAVALPAPTLIQVGCGICLWFLHAQPSFFGFWAGLEHAKKRDDELFAARTERWLAEWEDTEPGWVDWT